ncbi:ATPase family protein associated with various cellular activities (AAA) [Humibacillus xanthopallidus]|uniref:ATPase family protein associated with various cellular activities (AAA) n=1 Tax=Humibacillus xanthopallidus TaxID=412689 RepID=A0A543PML8_9MICO|nr:AAA family ATPase [Humibacillus xanthopallidus]TQN45303.1 ATPase family protein associated with various cellular activities (AAA) [Humibacillus xanthopallidus]
MSARSRLAESLDDLSDIAAEAGLDPAAARDEGLRVAAALAESVPGAATEWARVAHPGVTDLRRVNEAFFDAASSARRWRGAPTDLLEALVASRSGLAVEYAEALTEVASSAVMLGTAPIWVIANASVASAAYLDAAQGGVLHSAPLGGGFSGGLLDGIRPLPAGALGLPDVLRPNLPSLLDPSLDPRVDPPAAQGDPPAPGAQATAGGATPAPEPEKPAEPEKSVEELLAELDAMIGLARVKKEIHRQVALLTVEKMRTHAGLKAPRMSRHLIFVGNPGTGKTTVARLIGSIYRALELLPQGQLVEVDRSELVAGYVGQTAMKTAEVCARATGGVLFIDEAYALTGDQYAEEAVNTLVKEMEDRREELVVIVAGYPDPMVRFIGQNPGLASRFTTTIEFDDYTDEELLAILDSIAAGSDYELTPEARTRVGHILQATPRTSAFGNGRFSRNLFEQAVGRHAWRLKDATEPTRDDLRLLTADDFTEQPDEPVETEVLEPPDESDPVPLRADPDSPEPADGAGSDEQTATSEDTR